MKSSIYTIPAGETPEWEDGVRNLGWVYVTKSELPIPADATFSFPRDVIHCAPGTEPPKNVTTVVVKGHEQEWQPKTLADEWPEGAPYVLEAMYLTPAVPDGEPGRTRCKIVEVPEGATVEETNLVPHQWAGDE